MNFQQFWNIMLATDSYKATHHRMLPDGLSYAESYAESRGGEIPYTLFYGMLYYLETYLSGVQVTEEKIQEAVEFYNEHYGVDNVFNEAGWRLILTKYDGKLPIQILALKEGTILKTSNVLYKIVSLDKDLVWLVNWVETLLMKTWYPITIASNSAMAKGILNNYANLSSDNPFTDFLLVDFGYRGVSSEETAWIGGSAHLLSFKSSDNIAGIRMLKYFYNSDKLAGYSVPATEHMVMTIRGRENEIETYRDILRKHGKETPFSKLPLSLVSDTYNIYEACKFLFDDDECRTLILEREGPVIVRPDSGDPITVLCGDINSDINSDENIGIVQLLANKFGYTINSKGYKVINKVKILQGDGISVHTMSNILNKLIIDNNWSLDNFVFGSGGGLLQKVDRDTMKFAIKCSFAVVDGKDIDVYKDPITSHGSKKSKRGRLNVIRKDNEYITVNHHDMLPDDTKYCLEPVYMLGEMFNKPTYNSIMSNIESHFDDTFGKITKF